MQQRVTSIALAFLAAGSIGALLGAQPGLPPAPPVSFAKDVQPILENNCLSCHGAAMQMGKLDLRTRESALQGGAHGAVLQPASAEQSKLYRMVAGLEKPSMPMSGTLADLERPDDCARGWQVAAGSEIGLRSGRRAR